MSQRHPGGGQTEQRPKTGQTVEISAQGSKAPDPPLERMKPQDGMWLQDTPANLMIVNAVYSLDQMDLETLRQLWQERVLQVEDGKRYPRFTKRVVTGPRGVCWQEHVDFDLADHIFEAPEADRIDSKEKLQDFVGEMAAKPLPRELPLWQIQLIPELVPGISALIFRIHHCMGDGIALVPVLFSLMDRDDPSVEAFANPQPLQVGAGKGGRSKLAVGLAAAFAGGPVLLGKAIVPRDSSPLHGPECSGVKRVAWTDEIDLGGIKEVKNSLGATVNDVLMACVAGAFQRYAETHGEPLKRFRVSMPVNVRWPTEPLLMENRFATVLLKLPAAIRDVRERVLATKQRMDRLKRSVEPFVMFGAQNLLLYTLPSAIGRKLVNFYANKTTCVLTNVPGPQVPLSVGGRRIRGMVFWVPQRDLIGIGVSIFSMAGSLRVGVIADAALMPDPGALVTAFEDEFAALRGALAG